MRGLLWTAFLLIAAPIAIGSFARLVVLSFRQEAPVATALMWVLLIAALVAELVHRIRNRDRPF